MITSLETRIDTSEYILNVMQNSRIFAGVDRAVCAALLPKLQKIHLKQGQTLFAQGDISDCLYIVIEGQLLATLLSRGGKQKMVGTVEEGETVGELGTLSHQPRTLTVRAAVDSLLLKFPRLEFENFCKEQSRFTAKVIELVIQRSQEAMKIVQRKKVYQHIAIIRGDEHVDFDKFICNLQKNLGNDAKFIFVNQDQNDHLLSIIEKEEHEHISVIFILDQAHFENLRIKLTHIGGIYVVVDGDKKNVLDAFALKMLNRLHTPFTTQYELVLLHDDQTDKPKDTIHWLQQADFTLHHHIKMNDHSAYLRLLRFMKGQAIGVVLGGGGVKGWASLGALRAILEADIPIDAIGGTSAGSGLAACYASSLCYETTKKWYARIVDGARKSFGWREYTWPIISVLSARYTTDTLQEVFQEGNIEDLWLNYFSISANLNTNSEVIHRKGLIWEAVRATAALPGIAPPVVIDGELHFDGGLINNLPVDQMRNLLGDDAYIFAVSLTRKSKTMPKYHFPSKIPFRIALLKKLGLGYKNYEFPPFFNTFIQAMLIGSEFKEKLNQRRADVAIQPDLSKFKPLDFDIKKIETMVNIGYQEMREQLQKK